MLNFEVASFSSLRDIKKSFRDGGGGGGYRVSLNNSLDLDSPQEMTRLIQKIDKKSTPRHSIGICWKMKDASSCKYFSVAQEARNSTVRCAWDAMVLFRQATTKCPRRRRHNK